MFEAVRAQEKNPSEDEDSEAASDCMSEASEDPTHDDTKHHPAAGAPPEDELDDELT